ncbi:MAG: tetratricopeptide repeat protein [Hyphomonadaceae bacterium]
MDRTLAIVFGGVALALVLAPLDASAQSGWQQFSDACSHAGGKPRRGGEVAGHPTAWCDYSGGNSGSSSSGRSGLDAEDRALIRSRERARDHRRAVELNDLGIAAKKKGDLDKALSYYTEANKLWPEDKNIARNLSRARADLAREQAGKQSAAATEKAADAFASDQKRGGKAAPVKGLTFMTGADGGVQLNPGAQTPEARALAPAPESTLNASGSALEQLKNATGGQQDADATFEDARNRTGAAAPVGSVKIVDATPTIDPVVPPALANDPIIVKALARRDVSRSKIADLQRDLDKLDLSKPDDQVRAANVLKQKDDEQNIVNVENLSIADMIAAATKADGPK